MQTKTHAIPIATVTTAILLWCWLFRSCLLWAIQFISREEYILNGFFLFVFIALMAKKIIQGLKESSRFLIGFEYLPFALFCAGIAGHLVALHYLDINILATVFMGISGFGFCGLLLPRERWKSTRLFFFLFILILPFNYHLETFVGFPLRLLAAKFSHQIMLSASIDSVSVESIILLENRVAYIALPCSGLKSLWAGSLFFILLSILENYRISIKWLGCMAASILFVIAANIFRILCLVVLHAMNAPQLLNEIIHIPLGVTGFTVSCLFIYFISRRLQKNEQTSISDTRRYNPGAAILLLFILVAAICCQPMLIQQHEPTIRTRLVDFPFPHQPAEPSDLEKKMFIRHGVSHYQKIQYTFGSISGTLFLIKSKSWRGHHNPEQCMIGRGLTISNAYSHLIDASTPIHLVAHKEENSKAAYWFVSRDQITDDYGSRVWANITHPDKEWVMVNTYFTTADTHYLNDLEELTKLINTQLQHMLSEGVEE